MTCEQTFLTRDCGDVVEDDGGDMGCVWIEIGLKVKIRGNRIEEMEEEHFLKTPLYLEESMRD